MILHEIDFIVMASVIASLIIGLSAAVCHTQRLNRLSPLNAELEDIWTTTNPYASYQYNWRDLELFVKKKTQNKRFYLSLSDKEQSSSFEYISMISPTDATNEGGQVPAIRRSLSDSELHYRMGNEEDNVIQFVNSQHNEHYADMSQVKSSC